MNQNSFKRKLDRLKKVTTVKDCQGCEYWGAKEIIEEPKEDILVLIMDAPLDPITKKRVGQDRYFEIPEKCPRGFDECRYHMPIRFALLWSLRECNP